MQTRSYSEVPVVINLGESIPPTAEGRPPLAETILEWVLAVSRRPSLSWETRRGPRGGDCPPRCPAPSPGALTGSSSLGLWRKVRLGRSFAHVGGNVQFQLPALVLEGGSAPLPVSWPANLTPSSGCCLGTRWTCPRPRCHSSPSSAQVLTNCPHSRGLPCPEVGRDVAGKEGLSTGRVRVSASEDGMGAAWLRPGRGGGRLLQGPSTHTCHLGPQG